MKKISGLTTYYKDEARTYTILERVMDLLFTLFPIAVIILFFNNNIMGDNNEKLWKRINTRFT